MDAWMPWLMTGAAVVLLGTVALTAALAIGVALLDRGMARAESPTDSCHRSHECAQNTDDHAPPAPLMTVASDDVENLQFAINKCWNIGVLSTRAQQVTLVLRVEVNEQGKPKQQRITMASFSGGEEDSVEQAFQDARRAVIRSQKGCGGKQGFVFDPAKYTLPGAIEMTFDTSGMRLR